MILFPISDVIFYAFAVLLIASACMVIFAKNPVQSALYLVLAFVASAGLWIMANAEFLGLILILVYVGAVMTLFLFVIMTIPTESMPQTSRHWTYLTASLTFIGVFVVVLLHWLNPHSFLFTEPLTLGGQGNNTQTIGNVLYTTYLFAFELAGLLLLAAIIAAISLSYRPDRNKNLTESSKQIAVNAKSRLKIVDMPSATSLTSSKEGNE